MRAFLLFLLLSLLACDGGWPKSCGPIAQQSIYAGELIRISLCFTHPDDEMLSYSATSADPEVATVTVLESIMTIRAITPGATTITVMASSPEGNTTKQEIAVLIPNRAPELTREISGLGIQIGRTTEISMTKYFSDPDNETLSYEVAADDRTLLNATINGEILILFGIEKGETRITVTATDKAGASVMGEATVSIRNEALLFLDDFSNFSKQWQRGEAGFRIEDGYLVVWPIVRNQIGLVAVRVNGRAWTIETSMQYTDKDIHSNIIAFTSDKRFSILTADFGEHMKEGNVRLRVYEEARGWTYSVFGHSPDVKPNTFFEASLSAMNGIISIAVNGKIIISEIDPDYYVETLTRAGLGAGPINQIINLESRFDWFRVFGTAETFSNTLQYISEGDYR